MSGGLADTVAAIRALSDPPREYFSLQARYITIEEGREAELLQTSTIHSSDGPWTAVVMPTEMVRTSHQTYLLFRVFRGLRNNLATSQNQVFRMFYYPNIFRFVIFIFDNFRMTSIKAP